MADGKPGISAGIIDLANIGGGGDSFPGGPSHQSAIREDDIESEFAEAQPTSPADREGPAIVAGDGTTAAADAHEIVAPDYERDTSALIATELAPDCMPGTADLSMDNLAQILFPDEAQAVQAFSLSGPGPGGVPEEIEECAIGLADPGRTCHTVLAGTEESSAYGALSSMGGDGIVSIDPADGGPDGDLANAGSASDSVPTDGL